MQLLVRLEAQSEPLQAQAWYEQRAQGLGLDFARAAEAAMIRALRMPLAFPRIEADFRQVVMRRFPYSVIYHPSETELVVVSFFHHRRRRGLWLPSSNNFKQLTGRATFEPSHDLTGCQLRRRTDHNVYVIATDHPFDYPDSKRLAGLPNQLSRTLSATSPCNTL